MTQAQAAALTELCKTYWPYDKGAQAMSGEAAFLLLESCDAKAARDFILSKAKAGERFAPSIGQIYAAVRPQETERRGKIDLRAVRWAMAWGQAVERGKDPNEACREADAQMHGVREAWI